MFPHVSHVWYLSHYIRWHLAALRASLGHPKPYPLKWVEIGNEDFVQPSTYAAYRWPAFVGNLSKTFPNLREFRSCSRKADLIFSKSSLRRLIHSILFSYRILSSGIYTPIRPPVSKYYQNVEFISLTTWQLGLLRTHSITMVLK